MQRGLAPGTLWGGGPTLEDKETNFPSSQVRLQAYCSIGETVNLKDFAVTPENLTPGSQSKGKITYAATPTFCNGP